MKHMVFTVFDKAVGAYLQPFFSRSRGEALRSFSDAVNDSKSQFFVHPADFYLVFCGVFDDNSGIFSCADPERVISAVECANVVSGVGPVLG